MAGLATEMAALGSLAQAGAEAPSVVASLGNIPETQRVQSTALSVAKSSKQMTVVNMKSAESSASVLPPPDLNNSGPIPLPLQSGEAGVCCGIGGPPKEIIPGKLHALIPSKFKYKFPRERIPRHGCYEVLAVEDNPYAAPPAPVPPKVPHKKKSIFGIAKRIQTQPKRYTHPSGDAVSASVVDPDAGRPKGWACDFKCFLCTSTDFVSEEQAMLQRENFQLDEALAEYQDTTRVQAIQLLEARKSFEERLNENLRASEEAAQDIAATKAALEQIQAERDHLLQLQQQTDQSLAIIREQVGRGLDTLLQTQSVRADELVEQMRSFCIGVTDMITKALPAERQAATSPSPSPPGTLLSSSPFPMGSPSPAPTATAPFQPTFVLSPVPVPSPQPVVVAPVVSAPAAAPARKLKKKGKKKLKGKGKKKVVKKKGKKAAGKGRKTKRTKVTKKKPSAAASGDGPGEPLPEKSLADEPAQPVSQTAVGRTQAETAALMPFAFPFNAPGQTVKGALDGQQFIVYPGVLDSHGLQPNDQARFILEHRLAVMKHVEEATKAAAAAAQQAAAADASTGDAAGGLATSEEAVQSPVRRSCSSKSVASSAAAGRPQTAKNAPPEPPNKLNSLLLPRRQASLQSLRKASPLPSKSPAAGASRSATGNLSELSEELDSIRKKSLGRLWSLRDPPPLPPGLLSRISQYSAPRHAATLPARLVPRRPLTPANTWDQ